MMNSEELSLDQEKCESDSVIQSEKLPENNNIVKKEKMTTKKEKPETEGQKTLKRDREDNGNINGSQLETKKMKTPTLVDPWYKFEEINHVEMATNLSYKPSYFLRTHSKNNNPADVQTQIWQCLFPPPSSVGKLISKEVVATCGGSSLCFIEVNTGEVLLKYNRSAKSLASENLYALAWSTLEVVNDEDVDTSDPDIIEPTHSAVCDRSSIIATAGGKCTVVLIDVEAGFCYHMFRTVTSKANAIVCSLLFHPKKQSWLFCGHEDGHIQLWDIGILSRPNYTQTRCVALMTLPGVSGDVYNMQFCHQYDLLIAGCNDACLVVYDIDIQKVANGEKCPVTKAILPNPEGLSGTDVDSIVLLKDNILAAKCALHAQIYLFNIKTIVNRKKETTEHKNVDFIMNIEYDDIVRLNWSDTDNYYMNMGADPRTCTIVCGDDKGTIWMYNLLKLVTGNVPSPLTGGAPLAEPLPATAKLLWPNLQDPEVEKAGKLRLDTYDIVVDKCCVSEGAKHIVAVTSNNMVCIWSNQQDEQEE